MNGACPGSSSPVSAEDWRAAVDLVARFEEAVDRRDAEAFAGFFTADGSVTGQMSADHRHLRGIGAGHDADGPPLMHLTANHVVEAAPAGLRIRYLLVVIALGPGAPALLRTSRVTDLLRPTPDGWRIHEHHVATASSLDRSGTP